MITRPGRRGARHRAADRHHRLRQVDHAGGDHRPHQPDDAQAHRHDRGPDRVPAPGPASRSSTSARSARTPASFKRALRRVLRQDPDVILVGEMRDEETVQTALSAAETGHLVLSTLHTVDATETVNRIIDFFPPHQQAAGPRDDRRHAEGDHLPAPRPDRRTATAASRRARSSSTGRVHDFILDPKMTGSSTRSSRRASTTGCRRSTSTCSAPAGRAHHVRRRDARPPPRRTTSSCCSVAGRPARCATSARRLRATPAIRAPRRMPVRRPAPSWPTSRPRPPGRAARRRRRPASLRRPRSPRARRRARPPPRLLATGRLHRRLEHVGRSIALRSLRRIPDPDERLTVQTTLGRSTRWRPARPSPSRTPSCSRSSSTGDRPGQARLDGRLPGRRHVRARRLAAA